MDARLQETLESRVRVDDRFGEAEGAIARRRMCELMAADTLAIAASLPTLDFETADSATGRFSVQLTELFRLRFEIAADQIPRQRGSDEIDLEQVNSIRILDVEEVK